MDATVKVNSSIEYTVLEVDASLMKQQRGTWVTAAQDIALRLTRTAPDKALQLTFANDATAKAALAGIRKALKTMGKTVTISRTGCRVYVKNGGGLNLDRPAG